MAIEGLTREEAARLLADLRAGLNADGYELEVAGIGDKVELRIAVARDGVCEDCLIPKSLMSEIAASALQEGSRAISAGDIVLQYPVEH